MRSWFEKRFAGAVELRPGGGFEEFAAVFDAYAVRQPGAAIYGARCEDGTSVIYLTPACDEFARMIQAKSCADPPFDTFTLLCGDPGLG